MHILLLEDSETDKVLIRRMLLQRMDAPLNILLAGSLREGLEKLVEQPPDVVLLDLFLPDSSGIATFERIYAHVPQTPIVLITSLDDEATALEAVRLGAQDYLFKGEVTATILKRAITYAVERHRLLNQLAVQTIHLRERVKEITTLHQMAHLLQDPDLDLQMLLERIAALLPPAFQFPEFACACVSLGDMTVTFPAAATFSEPMLAVRFHTAENAECRIEVCYVPGAPPSDPVFFKEEEALLSTLKDMLCNYFERRHALRQVREQQETIAKAAAARLALINALPVAVIQLDAQGTIVAANDGWERLLLENCYTPPGFAIGENFFDVFSPATGVAAGEAPFVSAGVQKVLEASLPSFQIEFLCLADGHDRWYRMIATPFQAELRGGAVIMYMDITSRKAAQQDLLQQKELLLKIFDHIPVMVSLLAPNATVTWANREWERITGWTLEAARNVDVVSSLCPDPAIQESALEFVREAPPGWKDFSIHTRNGKELVTSWACVALSDGTRIAIGQDLTHRKQLEAQLAQSQKMESVGRLAGGIAHDFNNLLSAILGYCEFALASVGHDDTLKSDIEQIQSAGIRATDLTRQLLAFARRQIIEPRLLNINELIAGASKLLRRLIGEDIELVMLFDSEPVHVTIDPGQFEQVLVNLAVNARDAMPSGGKLTIQSTSVCLDDSYQRSYAKPRTGPHVLITVSDTGPGMSEEALAHVFEPFFTTKEVNKGTGLGLATCYGIIKQAEGDIWVSNAPGPGATVKIYLPVVQLPAPTTPPAPETVRAVQGGAETILLVEDEPLVREMVNRALGKLGYSVLVAETGLEALRVAQEHAGTIHLLLTDVVMPHMGGKEVAERITAEQPAIKVLFMSGYTEDTVIRRAVHDADVAFLAKPFTARALAAKVRELLDL